MTITTGGRRMTTGVETSKLGISPIARHLADNLGPKCRRCLVTEARCAFVGGCCSDCQHFAKLDANGNDKPRPPAHVDIIDNRPWCGTCGRQVTARGRFDCPGVCSDVRRAYDRARPRRAS